MANAKAEATENSKDSKDKVSPLETGKTSLTSMKDYYKSQPDQLTAKEKRKLRAADKIRQAQVTGDTRPRTKAGRLAKETGKKAVRMRPGGLTHIQMMIDHHEEFSGMSNDAIAARVGCSVSSVRRVKTELRKQGYYPVTIAQRVQAVLKEKETKKEC